jgi:hypothetical protein
MHSVEAGFADERYRHERLPQEEWCVLIRDAHPAYNWPKYASPATLRLVPMMRPLGLHVEDEAMSFFQPREFFR